MLRETLPILRQRRGEKVAQPLAKSLFILRPFKIHRSTHPLPNRDAILKSGAARQGAGQENAPVMGMGRALPRSTSLGSFRA